MRGTNQPISMNLRNDLLIHNHKMFNMHAHNQDEKCNTLPVFENFLKQSSERIQNMSDNTCIKE